VDKRELIQRLAAPFPGFAEALRAGLGDPVEEVLPPATPDDLAREEALLRISLPSSYREFLLCTRGFWLRGGVVQMSSGHPFFHRWGPFEALKPAAQRAVCMSGRGWPPPTENMLCFAEFFMEADGDQVLFRIHEGLVRGEYPVYYYAHEAATPEARLLEPSFSSWLNDCLYYDAFRAKGVV
jgi:hypothetical protein